MKATIATVSSMFLIIIVSLTGAICRQDTCNFDHGLCGWVQGEADNFNWTRTSGGGSTINTGPKSGHTTGNHTNDYYMYINALEQKEGDRAVLQSTGFDYEGRACLSFWYHMYGSHVGTLNINMRKHGDSPLLVWSKTGSQSKNWTNATVDLEIDSKVIIEFEGIRGNGHFGNMALDDVSLTYESCFRNSCLSNSFNGKPMIYSSKGSHVPQTTFAAIIGSVVGSLVFVMVLAIVAVCIFRKRRQKGKKPDFIEFQTVSSKHSGTVWKVENHSNAEHSANTGFIHSSNTSHPNDTSTFKVKAAMENYSYVATFVAKPTHGTDNTYDTILDETRPCLDGTYLSRDDDVTTHYNDLCDKTYETNDVSSSKSAANQAYDHVIKIPDGVYDKTYVTTQGTDGRDKAYDHVTIDACQTPVHISDNRN